MTWEPHDRINTDSDFPTPSGEQPLHYINRESDIVQEALQRTKLHMTQAGITMSDDEVFEYLANAVAAAKCAPAGPKPDRQDGHGLYMPTYGKLPWDQLGRDVMEAIMGRRDAFKFMSEGYPGHDMTGINFNSLARIVDKYRLATPQPTHDAAEGAEDVCSLQNPQGLALVSQLRAPSPKPAPDALRNALADKIERLGFVGSDDLTENEMRLAVASLRSSGPIPSADGAGDMRAALENARLELVMAISFLGRDAGSDRLQKTITTLIERFHKADDAIRAALASATGAAEPDYETAARALGFQQIPNGKWFHQGQNHNLERCFESAKEIFDRYFGSHWLATPPVRGDREATVPPVRRVECVQGYLHEEPAPPVWRLEINGIVADFPTETWANNFRDAILSLPVQPGADEREAINRDDVVRLVIAARTVAFGDDRGGEVGMHELDAASEQFASLVPWNDQPEKRS